jgi:excisionase family DNA binding protein
MHAILSSKRYTFREVAKLLGIHVATVWRWYLHGVRGRKLPAVLIGARRYVLAADLDTFLSAGAAGHQPDTTDLYRRADDAGRMLDAKGVRTKRHSPPSPRR